MEPGTRLFWQLITQEPLQSCRLFLTDFESFTGITRIRCAWAGFWQGPIMYKVLLVLSFELFFSLLYSYTHIIYIYTHTRTQMCAPIYTFPQESFFRYREQLQNSFVGPEAKNERKKKKRKKAFSSCQQSRAIHHLTEILPVFKQLGSHDFQPKYLAWQTLLVLTDAFITTSFHLKFQYKRRWFSLWGFFTSFFFFCFLRREKGKAERRGKRRKRKENTAIITAGWQRLA